MSINIISKIDEELNVLQKEVSTFRSAVAYLQGAKETVNSAVGAVKEAEQYHLGKLREIESIYERVKQLVNSVNSLEGQITSIDFPVRLSSIESLLADVVRSIDDTTKKALVEIQKSAEAISRTDFDRKFGDAAASLSDFSTATNMGLLELRKGLKEQDDNLSNAISNNGKQVIEHIKSLRLDQKMEKLDLAISNLGASIQYLQTRLDSVEGNVLTVQKESKEQLLGRINTVHDETQRDITSLKKSTNTHSYITWTLNFIMLAVLAYTIFYKK
jgi:prefoldin subunit 5